MTAITAGSPERPCPKCQRKVRSKATQKSRVVRHFNRLFRFDLSKSTLNNMKVRVAGYYAETKQKILEHIIRGRHLAGVARFYDEIGKVDYRSEAATKCKERFERNRDDAGWLASFHELQVNGPHVHALLAGHLQGAEETESTFVE